MKLMRVLAFALLAVNAVAQPKEVPREQTKPPAKGASVIFLATPQDRVEEMLDMAEVKKTDVVYDLGSGDGRIVITAAKKYQARGVGVEIDPDLVRQSRERIKNQGLEKLVIIKDSDFFATDITDATVVAIYLTPRIIESLKPQFDKLKPGTRIVAHQTPASGYLDSLAGVKPAKVANHLFDNSNFNYRLSMWVTPLKPDSDKKSP